MERNERLMYEGMVVRVIPRWMSILLYFQQPKGCTLGSTIYLCPEYFKHLTRGRPPGWLEAVLVHEGVHMERARAHGRIRFFAKYLLRRQFRFEEELAAIREELLVRYRYGETFDLNDRAEKLSGYHYL